MPPADPLFEKAFAEHKAGKFADAKIKYLEVLKRNPQNPNAHFLLGTLFCHLKDWTQALPHLSQAIALKPGYVEAHRNRANLFLSCEKYVAAIGDLEILVRDKPSTLNDNYNLGLAYKHTGQFEKARNSLEVALKIQPEFLPAQNILGVLQKDLGDTAKAIETFQKILKIKPDWPEAWFNLGVALREDGHYPQALEAYNQGLALDPQNAWGHFNRANCLILMDEIEKAWPEFDWRLKTEKFSYLTQYQQAVWQGESLIGKSLLIVGEQGLADELHFAACIPEILQQTKDITIECLPKLVSLFAQTFPQAHVVARPLDGTRSPLAHSAFDYMTPMGSLMRWVRPNKTSLESSKAFIKTDLNLSQSFQKQILELGEGLKVGICWQSMAPDWANSQRIKSFTKLINWKPLLTLPGIQWVSLQYGEASQSIAEAQAKLGVTIHTWDDVDLTDDLNAVASLIENLDLVISINSTAATLAATLGKQTWILVPWSYGSHWQTATKTDLFLPEMTYVRQPAAGDWEGLFEWIKQSKAPFLRKSRPV